MLALVSPTLAADKTVTITGEGACAKCSLKKTDTCQNTITTEKDGKKVTYYLTQNAVSKKFHDQICKADAKITATGTVKEKEGTLELTPTKIEKVE